MYGTVARLHIKPGAEAQLGEELKSYETLKIPGYVNTYMYKMDSDPNDYYMAVIFENKEAYTANAESPEQDARYREMLKSLASEPEWHDGEIISGL